MHIFDLYYATVLGFQFHPANPAQARLTHAQCADIALEACLLRDKYVNYLLAREASNAGNE